MSYLRIFRIAEEVERGLCHIHGARIAESGSLDMDNESVVVVPKKETAEMFGNLGYIFRMPQYFDLAELLGRMKKQEVDPSEWIKSLEDSGFTHVAVV